MICRCLLTAAGSSPAHRFSDRTFLQQDTGEKSTFETNQKYFKIRHYIHVHLQIFKKRLIAKCIKKMPVDTDTHLKEGMSAPPTRVAVAVATTQVGHRTGHTFHNQSCSGRHNPALRGFDNVTQHGFQGGKCFCGDDNFSGLSVRVGDVLVLHLILCDN